MHLWKEIEQQEDQELFYDEETYKDDFLYSDEHQFGEYEESIFLGHDCIRM